MKRSIRERMLATTMMGGAAFLALAAVPAITVLTPTAVYAQDYTTGTINGTVTELTAKRSLAPGSLSFLIRRASPALP